MTKLSLLGTRWQLVPAAVTDSLSFYQRPMDETTTWGFLDDGLGRKRTKGVDAGRKILPGSRGSTFGIQDTPAFPFYNGMLYPLQLNPAHNLLELSEVTPR